MKYWIFGIITTGLLLSFTYQNTFKQTGNASYYSNKFQGRRTASGAAYHKDSMYCAHKSLKYGTLLKVTNLKNDSTIIVKVVDRMGSRSPHIIDLSMAGAQKLNFVRNGIAKVQVEEYIPTPIAKAD
ncbi:septal ring lytic transglycosylase RlpA family protein [Fluviicola sp.]|uniref:septal ring lytic transglycosylase RlpA family protein n=1 Tax=Fluviicola sp. TaxID=1917219 RepID=UPI0031DC4A73